MRINRIAILCFLIVYIIWGSTYLAIRYAIETLPALGMSSARFFLAAAIMGAIALWPEVMNTSLVWEYSGPESPAPDAVAGYADWRQSLAPDRSTKRSVS